MALARRRLRAAALLAATLAHGPASADGDPKAGRGLAGQCRTCHGLDGVAEIPVAPNIGGESADYLVRQIAAFRSGEREQEMMSIVASSLDDAQIADVAAWYARFTPVATPPEGRDPADAPAACVECHGADGISPLPEAPHLAGESEVYLAQQLKAFRSGARRHEVMSEIAAGMSDQDIADAAAWYAAVGFETREE